MSRHALDRHDGASTARAERFSEIERQHRDEGSHPAAKAAHRQPKDRAEGTRMKEFARIERGDEV